MIKFKHKKQMKREKIMEKTTLDGKNAKITEITYPEKRKMFTLYVVK